MSIWKYFFLFMILSYNSFGQGLKTNGDKIVDHNGNEVILRGMGLGGWMLMEGYMMQSSDVADTQHEFRERLIELIGTAKQMSFLIRGIKIMLLKLTLIHLPHGGLTV